MLKVIIALYLIIDLLLFLSRYNTQWYIAPLHVQKLILFLLQRSIKTVSLNFGGVILLSLEFFATVKVISYACYINIYNNNA